MNHDEIKKIQIFKVEFLNSFRGNKKLVIF